jgi:UDP-N-acetylglucosamine 2-epimerase (non-hydrolysing)
LRTWDSYSVRDREYAVLTLHRPSNVDDPTVFEQLLTAIEVIAADQPVLFPVHPRTQKTVKASRRASALIQSGSLRLLDPLGYLEFISIMDAARVVLTDSGGVQEETTILRVPCLTLRTSTERPVTVTQGTNQIVGTQASAIIEGYRNIENRPAGVPELWDGRAAERIVEILGRV